MNARAQPEDSIALRVAVLVAVLAAALAVLGEGVGGTGLRPAVVVGIPAAFAWSHVSRHRSGLWLKAGLAVGVVVVFVQFLRAMSGLGGGSLAGAQIPLAELFVWVQLLHALDVPSRRDLLFSLVSSLILIGVAGVLSISLGYGLLLAVWGVAALASLALAQRSEMGQLPRLRSPDDETRAAPADGEPTRLRHTLGSLAVAVALVAALGTGAFFLMPPAGEARAVSFPAELPESIPTGLGGGLSNPSLGADDPGSSTDGERSGSPRSAFGYFGFSESLDTGARGRPDDTIVMRVRSSAPDFWRGQSFDRWDGRRWEATDEDPSAVRSSPPIELPPPVGAGIGGEELVQTFYVERAGPNIIFGASSPRELYFTDNAVFTLSDGTIRAGVELPEGTAYTVVSSRIPVTEDLLRAASGTAAPIPPEIASRYLQLPTVPERVLALAASLTEGEDTTYDKVRSIERWMATNTRYTLDIPLLPRGADAVEQFLFVDRQGFCEQIGTSLVVMLRSVGVPARLGVGYTAGERNPFTGLFEVRASDAHSWAEVYFPGLGWQIFDPTASVPLAGDSDLASAGSGLSAFLDSRVPSVPGGLPVVAGAVVVVGMAVIVGRLLGTGLAGRRARRSRSWADGWLADVEDLGTSRVRPRRPGESVRSYVEVLRHSAPDPRWMDAVAAVEWEAFAGLTPDAERRALADDVLTVARGQE